MGFEIGDTGTYITAAHPWILWDVGATYQPTAGPLRAANYQVPTADPDDSTVTDSLASSPHASPGTGCSAAFSIADEAGNVLVADGTHRKRAGWR